MAVVVVALAIAALGPLAAVVSNGRITAMELMSDPVEVVGHPWYVGAVSDLTTFVWASASAQLLVGALGLRRVDRWPAAAMGWLGLLAGVVTLDDRFVVHEILLPSLLGVPQVVTYLFYGAWVALVLVRYARV